jgi:predicted DsbA family dithiol-disulfide isomerase
MMIEIWADVVCPWAYIGKRRLEAALAGSELPAAEVEVVWRPYRIDPTAPGKAVPFEEALRDPVVEYALRRSANGATPEEVRLRLSDIAAEAGIEPSWRGAAWRASSHDAHRLLALAHERGGASLQNEIAERVMKANFLEGRDISDRAELAAIAAGSGFPEAAALLDTDAGDATVRELLLIGKARGVATSPTLVLGDRALAGAQSPSTIAEFLTTDPGAPRRSLPEEVERLRWAESLLEQRDPLGALALLAPLIAEHGQDPNIRRLTASAYFASAQLRRAREVLEATVADAPDDSYARLMLSRTLTRQGSHEEAAAHLRIAAAMTPEYA